MKLLITSIVDLRKSQHNRPHQFVKYLSRKHDVTVLSINDWWKDRQGDLDSYSSEFEDVFNRVNIVYMTNRKVSPILQEVFSTRRVKEVLREEDFDVHLNYNTLVSGYVASKDVKTVYDIADDLSAMIRVSPQIPSFLRPFGGVLGDIMMKKNIKLSEKVTVTTETLIDTYGIPMEKSMVLPNGVDTTLFKDYGDDKKGELGLDGFIIGYVGVLREWVDLEPVFMALKGLDEDVKFLVVGREGRFKENIELASRCGVSDRVIFTGMVPYSEVPKYISAMDVCLIPFKVNAVSKNALPLKLFEYMACGKPVISTELPGVKRVADKRVLYASTVEEYREKISLLYRDEDLRQKIGRDGEKLVKKNYNWENIVNRMEKLLLTIGGAS